MAAFWNSPDLQGWTPVYRLAKQHLGLGALLLFWRLTADLDGTVPKETPAISDTAQGQSSRMPPRVFTEICLVVSVALEEPRSIWVMLSLQNADSVD